MNKQSKKFLFGIIILVWSIATTLFFLSLLNEFSKYRYLASLSFLIINLIGISITLILIKYKKLNFGQIIPISITVYFIVNVLIAIVSLTQSH